MASGDLIALSDAKSVLYDEKFDNDELLQSFVSQASQLIKDELQTNIKTQTYTNEMHSGFGGNVIYLNHFPLQKLKSISVGEEKAVDIYHETAPRAFITTTEKELEVRALNDGVWDEETLVYSDYSVMSDLFDDISDTGWYHSIVTGYGNLRPDELVKESGKEAAYYENELYVPYTPLPDVQIRNEDKSSIYYGSGFGNGVNNVYVTYKAGWDVVPLAIKSATEELVKFMYELTEHDSTLTSEELGDYKYSAGIQGNPAVVFDNLNIGMIKAKLKPYKRLMIW